MTVSNPYIYVSTAQASHICYVVSRPHGESQFTIEPLFTDARQRDSLCHLVWRVGDMVPTTWLDSPDSITGKPKTSPPPPLPANIVLLADKSGNVAGLFHPHTQIQRFAGNTLFEACLERSVIRLQHGNVRPPWRRHTRNISEDLDELPGVTGVLNDEVIGVCSDGTVYGFSILSAPSLKLLRFLQNLVEFKRAKNPELRHSIIGHKQNGDVDMMNDEDELIKTRDVDPSVREKGNAAIRNRHVNGDVLIRFFNEEGGSLKSLVEEDTEESVGSLFKELALDVMAQEGSFYGNEVYDRIREWVGEVLMPLL